MTRVAGALALKRVRAVKVLPKISFLVARRSVSKRNRQPPGVDLAKWFHIHYASKEI
jgi:hypothetical protein